MSESIPQNMTDDESDAPLAGMHIALAAIVEFLGA